MIIYEHREWMVQVPVKNNKFIAKTLASLGWCWRDAYDKNNHHPLGYGHYCTFDPKIVTTTKKKLGAKVSRKLFECDTE